MGECKDDEVGKFSWMISLTSELSKNRSMSLISIILKYMEIIVSTAHKMPTGMLAGEKA